MLAEEAAVQDAAHMGLEAGPDKKQSDEEVATVQKEIPALVMWKENHSVPSTFVAMLPVAATVWVGSSE